MCSVYNEKEIKKGETTEGIENKEIRKKWKLKLGRNKSIGQDKT